MPDLPFVLVVLAIILTIVTLVGHGIWVLLAAIFGGGRTESEPELPILRAFDSGRTATVATGAARNSQVPWPRN